MINQSEIQTLLHLWKGFCELHFELFDLTSLEYISLLGGKIEELEENSSKKQNIVEAIRKLENERKEIIDLINSRSNNSISSIDSLIKLLEDNSHVTDFKIFSGYNNLLKDLIAKISTQNKKNQLFLHKAINQLQELKGVVAGTSNNQTYNAKGRIASGP